MNGNQNNERLDYVGAHGIQGDTRHNKTSDVRSQLRFLGEVETLKKKRQDEEERERLMRLARVSRADEGSGRVSRRLRAFGR